VLWEERPAIVAAFKDRRFRKMGQRLIYLERPDLMAAADRAQYERAIASRIARDDAETPWLTLPRAMADLDDLMIDADPEHVAFLHEHRTHLADPIARAALVLNRHEPEMIVAN
jgi:exodeoxyribonuclease I